MRMMACVTVGEHGHYTLANIMSRLCALMPKHQPHVETDAVCPLLYIPRELRTPYVTLHEKTRLIVTFKIDK